MGKFPEKENLEHRKIAELNSTPGRNQY